MSNISLSTEFPCNIRTKKDGSFDMRTREAKSYVADQARKHRENFPEWVPLLEDGTIDESNSIGRAYKKAMQVDTFGRTLTNIAFSTSLPSQQQKSASSLPSQQQKSASSLPSQQQKSASPLPIQQQKSASPLPSQQQKSDSPLPIQQQISASPLPSQQQKSDSPLPSQQQKSASPQPSQQIGTSPIPSQQIGTSPIPSQQIGTASSQTLQNVASSFQKQNLGDSSSKVSTRKLSLMDDIPCNIRTKKNGTFDMRTREAKSYVADQAQIHGENFPAWVPLREDGTIDESDSIGRAYKKAMPLEDTNERKFSVLTWPLQSQQKSVPSLRNQQKAGSPQQSFQNSECGSSSPTTSTIEASPNYEIPLNIRTKKDGTFDMRTREAKMYVADQARIHGEKFPFWVPLREDGSTIDESDAIGRAYKNAMQWKTPCLNVLTSTQSQQHASTTPSSSLRNILTLLKQSEVSLANNIPCNIRTKKDGTFDMRTLEAKAYVADQAGIHGENFPDWVPLRKDGAIDEANSIGRAYKKSMPFKIITHNIAEPLPCQHKDTLAPHYKRECVSHLDNQRGESIELLLREMEALKVSPDV